MRNNVLFFILNLSKKKQDMLKRRKTGRIEKNPIARRRAVEDTTKVGNMQQSNREEGFVEKRYK